MVDLVGVLRPDAGLEGASDHPEEREPGSKVPAGRDFLLYDLEPSDRVYVVNALQVILK